MPDLRLHGRPVHTVFDLLGDKEDDITYSFGWALANSDALASRLLMLAFPAPEFAELGELTALRLQESARGAGRTDVEVETERAHVILEAKRGWNLPSLDQLTQYAGRFSDSRAARLLVVAECSSEWAGARLPAEVSGVPVLYVSWAEVAAMVGAVAATAGAIEKRLLREFVRYLKGLMTMQDPTSNMVFVVSLGVDDLFDSGVSFADIVVKHDRYFHPMGGGPGGWPKTPPNYLGFRFHGKLQQVRHVERYDVLDEPWNAIPGLAGKPDWGTGQPHFMYELGPAIVPSKTVKTGKLYATGRVWAALDLLLTCDTVFEARDKTNERLAAVGAGG